MQDIAEQFFELFQGSEIAHGTFIVSQSNGQVKQQGAASVVRLPTTVELWKQHLSGSTGLGIIPIRTDNTCYWGAIDVDDYSVQHQSLAQKLASNSIPVYWDAQSLGERIYGFFAMTPYLLLICGANYQS